MTQAGGQAEDLLRASFLVQQQPACVVEGGASAEGGAPIADRPVVNVTTTTARQAADPPVFVRNT